MLHKALTASTCLILLIGCSTTSKEERENAAALKRAAEHKAYVTYVSSVVTAPRSDYEQRLRAACLAIRCLEPTPAKAVTR